MNIRTKAAATALLLGIAAAPALAQAQETSPPVEAAAAGDDQLQDIGVTAQRRTERLQTAPLSATALDADALTKNAVTNLADLQTATPALSVANGGIIQNVNIRGIGLASDSPNVTAGVATYVDGLFQPPIVQANSFYDLASVEVLRGPQGTLVGSNSTGGAIFVNSKGLDLDGGIGGYGEVGYGNYNALTAEGALNLPISATLGVRVAGFYRRHDSYYRDIGPFANDAGRLDEKGGRVTVLWQPGSFSATAKISLNNRDTGGYPYRPIPGTRFAAYRVGDSRTLSFDTPTGNRDLGFQAGLELRQELANGITLGSLTGYQNKRIKNLFDVDGSQAPAAVGAEISQDYSRARSSIARKSTSSRPLTGRSTGFWAAISSATTFASASCKARAVFRPTSPRSTSAPRRACSPRAVISSPIRSRCRSAAAIRPTRRRAAAS